MQDEATQTTATGWQAGQKAVIGRIRVVTIERVTPSGRAVIGHQTFKPDGHQLGGDPYRSPRLELLTPEIHAEMTLINRGRIASNEAGNAVEMVLEFIRDAFGSFGRRVPKADDVAKAERVVAAIKHAMKDA